LNVFLTFSKMEQGSVICVHVCRKSVDIPPGNFVWQYPVEKDEMFNF